MNATVDQIRTPPSATKPLWIAVGALGAAVLAMAATLVDQQAQPAGSRLAPVPAITSSQTGTPVAVSAPIAAPQAAMKQDEAEKPATAPVKKAPTATKSAASKSDKGHASTPIAHSSNNAGSSNAPSVASGYPAPQPVRSICSHCGTVESAAPIQREGAGTGLGAVAGGVLGAVVGNQVGGGNGRTAATVLGALGGGWAGNTVEKKMKTETLYQVRVRMEDGGSRTFEVATPVSAGSRVTVEGGSLRMADGSLASPLPARPQRQTQSDTGTVQTGG